MSKTKRQEWFNIGNEQKIENKLILRINLNNYCTNSAFHFSYNLLGIFLIGQEILPAALK